MAKAVAAESYTDHRARRRVARAAAKTVAYETAGPTQLAAQPSAMIRRIGNARDWLVLYNHLQARLNMLRAWRFSWMAHYQLLEAYLLPRRGTFINASQPTPNTMVRGAVINQNIIDGTGTYALRVCASGLMSGLCSPSRPWFKLKPALFARELAEADAQIWFEEVERRMYIVLARSNFYDATAQMFEDLACFGTGPVVIYEDEADVIRCYVPCPGEYFIASSSTLKVEPFFRLFVFTVSQIVEMFKLENCPPEIQSLWQQKGSALEQERIIAHAIEPNFAINNPGMGGDFGQVKGDFTWREAYWVWGVACEYPLSLRGFKEQPHVVPRWAVTSNDAYGRSVGMDVLGDVIQLQTMTKREAEGIEKMVRPPMLASMEMKNEPSSTLPGHLTYVNGLGPEKGMRPAYTVNPQIQEMMLSKKEVQARIKDGFFNNLFQMMAELEGVQPRNQMEISERRSEKLQILGPVIERWQNEYASPVIRGRLLPIMARRGLLPPLPPSLHGVPLDLEYIGALTLAQKAAASAGLERFAQIMMSLRQVDPSVDDLWDRDEYTRETADTLSISKRILNSPAKIASIRQQKQQQQQQQEAAHAAMAAVGAAKDASQIDVGGGMNAISMMTGMGPSPSGAQQ